MSEINVVNVALCETCRHHLDCSDVGVNEKCHLWRAVDSYCNKHSMKHLRDFYDRENMEAVTLSVGGKSYIFSSRLKWNVLNGILGLIPNYLDSFTFEEYTKHLNDTFDYILDNYDINCELFKKVSYGSSNNTDDEQEHRESKDTSYLAISNRDDALKIASMLIDNDYAVMLTTEEDITIINYVNCCYSSNFARNDVVFMHRDDFENCFE